MKEMKRPSYISAYPLRALEQAQASAAEPANRTGEESVYLKGLLADRAKSMSRIRVSPMSDPYKAPVTDPVFRASVIPSEGVDPDIKDWFNHYE